MDGIRVILSYLGGNKESAEAFQAAMGKEISSLSLGEDEALHMVFADGSKLAVYDDGQSCCESRYMRTDDDLAFYVGAKLLGGTVKDGPTAKDEYDDEHEIQFLEIQTSKGVITFTSHNEHNGYYGGFAIRAKNE